MVSFRNKCNFFARKARIYLKGVLILFQFCAILGLGSEARFSLKHQNVIFICIMKGKKTVYHQNKVEKNQNSNRLL